MDFSKACVMCMIYTSKVILFIWKHSGAALLFLSIKYNAQLNFCFTYFPRHILQRKEEKSYFKQQPTLWTVGEDCIVLVFLQEPRKGTAFDTKKNHMCVHTRTLWVTQKLERAGKGKFIDMQIVLQSQRLPGSPDSSRNEEGWDLSHCWHRRRTLWYASLPSLPLTPQLGRID